MHGAGNDFVVMPDMRQEFPLASVATIQNICRRPDGIGSEGLILLLPPEPQQSASSSLRMRFFNPDGQEADLCGNGARCAARLAADLSLTDKNLTLLTAAGPVSSACLDDGFVRISFPEPTDWRFNLQLEEAQQNLCHFVNTGVPHAVFMVENLPEIDVKKQGAAVRYHPFFTPAGTNVNFMEVDRQTSVKSILKVRTYERGVEDETGACGTGMTACALIAGKLRLLHPPITVFCAHGDELRVDFQLTPASATNVTLTGPTAYVFEGKINIK